MRNLRLATYFLFATVVAYAIPLKAAPTWFLNPPISNDRTYYGIGKGQSVEQARSNALGDVSAQLKSKVAVEIETREVRNDDQQSGLSLASHFEYRASSQTLPISFSNFRIKDQSHDDGFYYVLIELDKDNLARDLKHNINSAILKIESITASLSDNAGLESLAEIKTAHSLRSDAENNIEVALGTGAAIDAKHLHAKLIHQLEKLSELASHYHIQVAGSNKYTEAKEIIRKKVFQETGIRSDKSARGFIIKVSEKSRKSEKNGRFKVQAQLVIDVIDANYISNTLYSNVITESSVSSESARAAFKEARTKLLERVSTMSLGDIVGLSDKT